MAEVMNTPLDAVEHDISIDRKDDAGAGDVTGNDAGEDNKSSIPNEAPDASSPPPQQPPSRRHDRDSRERRNDDRDIDRPPNRRSDYYEHRNRSPPGPPHRDYKRRGASPNSPQYRDRRGGHSPPHRRSPPYPPFKRSRRDDGGYDGRRGSPRGGFGSGDRRFVNVLHCLITLFACYVIFYLLVNY